MGQAALDGRTRPESPTPPETVGRTSRWSLLAVASGFVLLFLLQSPGRLAADTKMDVTLEPWRFLERATHVWNSSSDFGFLPNQYAGYLFPMGPFFLGGKVFGVPPWITQRLWMALLLTVGAWGLVRLADAMGIGRPATRVLAGAAYALSPVFLGRIGSTSVALTGAAMLPWIVLPLVLALRTEPAGRLSPRRAAALSGVAIFCTGGVNASVTMCVLLLPAVLLLFAGDTRRAWALRGWWFVAVVCATAWWMLALLIQGKYGLNFLPYTETAETTTSAASVAEALRGTTDWLAYLRLPSPWVPAATEYVTLPAPIVGSGVVAAAGLWGLARSDLPERRFLVVGAAVGVVAVAAAYPGEPSGIFADGFRELLSSPLGFLRNVHKFQPVVRVPIALGLAHALAIAPRRARSAETAEQPASDPRLVLYEDPAERRARLERLERSGRSGTRRGPLAAGARYAAVVVVVGALVAGITPALGGRVLPPGTFKEVPEYWVDAADWLSHNPTGGRTLVLPGTPFGEYSWGRPLDEPLQWLSTTPWGVRSLIPLGGVGVTRLMDGIERRLSLGSAPGLEVVLARAGIGQIVVRNDLQDKGWDTPPSSDQIRRALDDSNLSLVASFGPDVPARPGAKERLLDEDREAGEQVPSLEVWTVPGGASQVKSYPADNAMVVSGGSEATLQLAAQGVLDTDHAVVLASDLSGLDATAAAESGHATGDAPTPTPDPPAPDSPSASLVVGPNTTWVATDTFDRRDYELGVVHSSASYLLSPTEVAAGAAGPPAQWTDRPVTGHQTVSGYVDGTSVTASSYGFDLLQAPELAPFDAVDEATFTAWQARADPVNGSEGAWLRLDAGRPVSVAEISVWLFAETTRRPVAGAIRVTTEAGSMLNQVKRTEDEQRLRVPEGPTRWFQLTLVDVGGAKVDPVLGAGIREVQIPGVRFQRYTQVPSDVAPLFTGADAGSVTYSFDRERVDPSTPFGGDEERSITRRFEVPRDMAFQVTGSATFLLPADPSLLQPPDAPVATECGGGPGINIDGVRYASRIRGGTLADVAALRPLPVDLCSLDGVLRLGPGQHLLTVETGYQTLDSITMVEAEPRAEQPGPRSTQITAWSPERRAVDVGAGERAFLAVRENSNPSWTASLNGEQLTPVRLDGWQQGWIVPAGVGGTVLIENTPGNTYRRNLVVGGFLVLLLLVMLALPDRVRLRPRSDPDGVPAALDVRRFALAAEFARVPAWFWPAAFGTVSVALVAGPVALAVPAFVVVARRRPSLLPWVVFAGALAAGIVVAVNPGGQPASGAGAFSWYVQAAGALSLAAVLASLAAREPATGGDSRLSVGPSKPWSSRTDPEIDFGRRFQNIWDSDQDSDEEEETRLTYAGKPLPSSPADRPRRSYGQNGNLPERSDGSNDLREPQLPPAHGRTGDGSSRLSFRLRRDDDTVRISREDVARAKSGRTGDTGSRSSVDEFARVPTPPEARPRARRGPRHADYGQRSRPDVRGDRDVRGDTAAPSGAAPSARDVNANVDDHVGHVRPYAIRAGYFEPRRHSDTRHADTYPTEDPTGPRLGKPDAADDTDVADDTVYVTRLRAWRRRRPDID